MRTATVRELRNNYSGLLRSVKAGEEIVITQRGTPVARLVPEKNAGPSTVDWTASPALTRDRGNEAMLTPEESARLLKDSRGRW